MPSGGKRQGAGRKSVAEEEKTRELCKAAIEGKFGSIDAGFKFLLDSGEASLIKFVYEHAFGKPTDQLEGTIQAEMTVSFKDAE